MLHSVEPSEAVDLGGDQCDSTVIISAAVLTSKTVLTERQARISDLALDRTIDRGWPRRLTGRGSRQPETARWPPTGRRRPRHPPRSLRRWFDDLRDGFIHRNFVFVEPGEKTHSVCIAQSTVCVGTNCSSFRRPHARSEDCLDNATMSNVAFMWSFK